MKQIVTVLLAALMLLVSPALAEEVIINLLDHPDASYTLEEGAPILEVVYPNIHGSDACILRMDEQVMMIDCSTDDQAPLLVAPVLKAMGIDHIDVAFNSHPHDDHLTGFEFLQGTASIGKLLIAFDEDYNSVMRRSVRVLKGQGVVVERVQDGDVLHLGNAEMTVIQRTRGDFTTNDLSALLKIRCGERSLLSTGDVENRAQQDLAANPPACGMNADIMKYPHHGHAKLRDEFFRSISPRLAIITAHHWPAKEGFAYLKRMGVPGLSTWDAPIRLRTDGHIWVVDYLPMNTLDTGSWENR